MKKQPISNWSKFGYGIILVLAVVVAIVLGLLLFALLVPIAIIALIGLVLVFSFSPKYRRMLTKK